MTTGGSLRTEIKFRTAHAILLVSGKYVLQLRDDKPTIAAPGQWSLFGGLLKVLETPLAAIRREIEEELSIKGVSYRKLWFSDYDSDFTKSIVRTWFFVADVTACWPEHELREGKVARAFNFEELENLKIPDIMRDALRRFHKEHHKKKCKP